MQLFYLIMMFLSLTVSAKSNKPLRIVALAPHIVENLYEIGAGDLIVGFVEGMTNNIWFLDIGASFNAILPMSLAPWKVEFGAVREHLNVGEAVLCRVQEVDETHSAVATMKGMGLRKLKSGLLEEIPPHIIPQVIGKGGSMLQSLKDLGQCRMVVGQNGRVWLDGEHDGMRDVRAALQLIRDTAHLPGLKNRIDALANE